LSRCSVAPMAFNERSKTLIRMITHHFGLAASRDTPQNIHNHNSRYVHSTLPLRATALTLLPTTSGTFHSSFTTTAADMYIPHCRCGVQRSPSCRPRHYWTNSYDVDALSALLGKNWDRGELPFLDCLHPRLGGIFLYFASEKHTAHPSDVTRSLWLASAARG